MFSWKLRYAWDFDWKAANRHPILLNEGTRYEEPFGITRALEWAERLAR